MKRSNRMLQLIFYVTLAVTLIISANVFLVAVGKRHLNSWTDLSAYADTANLRNETLYAKRGNIYDAGGEIIGQDATTYDIICILDKNRPAMKGQVAYVDDPAATAEALAPILGMEKTTIYDYLTKPLYQTELGSKGRNLSREKMEEIQALDLNGIEFQPSSKRNYPLGTFASNLIGFSQANDAGVVEGKMGLEAYLNEYLSGTNGYTRYQADKNGYILPGMKEETVSPINGNDVYLTLDKTVQEALEEAFIQTAETFKVERVWGAVMEIKTGRVLGWGQYPSFDLNTLEIEDYNNFGSQLPYEPGSTFKSFLWAAAIDSGRYDGEALVDSSQYCYGASNRTPYRVSAGDSRKLGCITNAGYKNWGMIPFDYGLIYSSNSVAAAIETQVITPEIYSSYLEKFGFFQPVGTDGVKENVGIKNFTWPADKLAMSYGQGSTVTMLQMLQAYSAIFGDGTMVRPYFVDSVRDSYDPSNVLLQGTTEVVGHPISEATAQQVQDILYRVVNEDDGTGKYYRIPETEIIGKTGTTQVASSNGGGYASGMTISSLMSAMPADDPQYMVYYAFEAKYDKNSHFKSDAIKSLLRKVAIRYSLTSTAGDSNSATVEDVGNVVIESHTMPSLVNHTVHYAQGKLEGLQVELHVLGSGMQVIDQFPKENHTVNTLQRVFLLTDTATVMMPDMTGWTRKDVTGFWATTGYAIKMDGYGTVVSQSLPAGSALSKGQEIEVVFQ